MLKPVHISNSFIRILTISFVLQMPFATVALGQSALEIIRQCENAIKNDQTDVILELATLIATWEDVTNVDFRWRGAQCLREATGERWSYSTVENRFISLQAMERTVRERNELLHTRKCELLDQKSILISQLRDRARQKDQAQRSLDLLIEEAHSATVSACYSWYENQPQNALTSPVCSEVFNTYGLRLEDYFTAQEKIQLHEGVESRLEVQINLLDDQLFMINSEGILPEEAQREHDLALRESVNDQFAEEDACM